MKESAMQDISNTLVRRDFVQRCLGATVGATWVINGEMKTMATEGKQSIEESQIRKRIEDWVTAFRSKDIESVMRVFAPFLISYLPWFTREEMLIGNSGSCSRLIRDGLNTRFVT